MVYFYWTLIVCAAWFVFGVLALAEQWKDIVAHMSRLMRAWDHLEAIPPAERTAEQRQDYHEICDELGRVVIALCIWCGPVLAIPAALAWIKGEIFG